MLLLENAELLARFRAGDRETMEVVFRHYSEPLARYLASGVSFSSDGLPATAEGLRRHELHDVLAETFRRAFEPRARLAYTGLVPFQAYLKRIARNLVIDRLRAASRVRAEAGSGHEPAATEPSPERIYQASEVRRLVRDFIDALPAEEQQLVALRFEQDLPQVEVAKRLGKTRKWVRVRETAVRRRLVVHMKRTGYLGPGASRVAGGSR